VKVVNWPAPPAPTPLRFHNVPFIDVLIVVFKVLLALLLVSPAVFLIFTAFMALMGAIGLKLFGS
jgi:hypothetical protein